MVDDFDKILRRVQERMERYMIEFDKMMRKESSLLPRKRTWGFHMRLHPDGSLEVQRFDDEPKLEMGSKKEPLVDKIETDEHFTIVIEVPGLAEEEIEHSVKDGKLVVSSKNENWPYYAEVELLESFDLNYDASYRNGVFEAKFKKK